MNKVYLAFYKKKRKIESWQTFIYRLADTLTKIVTLGKYSHCEFAVAVANNNYRCYSSSLRDGGVRCKVMPLPSEDWDMKDVSHLINVEQLDDFYLVTKGMPYDVIGLQAPVFFSNLHSIAKWFCSEWCAAAMKLDKPHQYSPTSLWKRLDKL